MRHRILFPCLLFIIGSSYDSLKRPDSGITLQLIPDYKINPPDRQKLNKPEFPRFGSDQIT
ncbi:MAG: hypothetical protein WBB31_15850, partial [Saprospiraceae bacterium]